MIRYIFVNCIAAGPIDWKRSLTADGQPGILEAYWIATDDDLAVQEEAYGNHGGVSSSDLRNYADWIARDAIPVGHSVEYHHGHLRAEMLRRGSDPCDGRVKTICTMLGLTGHVPKFNGRKGWPTFNEACHHFGITRADTESSEDNARCLRQVFEAMQRAGIVPEPKIWKERMK